MNFRLTPQSNSKKTEEELKKINESNKESMGLSRGIFALTMVMLAIGIFQLIFTIAPVEGSGWTKAFFAILSVTAILIIARIVTKDLLK